MDQTAEAQPHESREVTLDLCACTRTAGPAEVVAALLACPGVEKAHVDTHLTWALATFDPRRTDVASIVGQMSAAGLEVSVIQLLEVDETPAPDGVSSRRCSDGAAGPGRATDA